MNNTWYFNALLFLDIFSRLFYKKNLINNKQKDYLSRIHS